MYFFALVLLFFKNILFFITNFLYDGNLINIKEIECQIEQYKTQYRNLLEKNATMKKILQISTSENANDDFFVAELKTPLTMNGNVVIQLKSNRLSSEKDLENALLIHNGRLVGFYNKGLCIPITKKNVSIPAVDEYGNKFILQGNITNLKIIKSEKEHKLKENSNIYLAHNDYKNILIGNYNSKNIVNVNRDWHKIQFVWVGKQNQANIEKHDNQANKVNNK
ncbi:hypothetical protein [Candidatus Nesciobacter abundans]|uniref:Uncharacterized protein n=1 Tax=Candidatus Nesciobacter abundans TaxID=2601668 RepID=A0A5C0UI00_9PROT|nr:hypothetical protein [Candidatus Nesciobacter abundans]QEK39002.1 hypothetical protein FZC36_00945 [Candidatus Nesciobacter abundans]